MAPHMKLVVAFSIYGIKPPNLKVSVSEVVGQY